MEIRPRATGQFADLFISRYHYPVMRPYDNTQCPHGHPREGNTYVSPKGKRSCRPCSNTVTHRWYLRNADKKKAYARHKQLLTYMPKTSRRRGVRNQPIPSRLPKSRRAKHLEYRYGLTEDKLTTLLNNQGNQCAVCKTSFDMETTFTVDHDHLCCPGEYSCGKCIRGLLCDRCNRTLGMAKDNWQRLQALSEYLQAWESAHLHG